MLFFGAGIVLFKVDKIFKALPKNFDKSHNWFRRIEKHFASVSFTLSRSAIGMKTVSNFSKERSSQINEA